MLLADKSNGRNQFHETCERSIFHSVLMSTPPFDASLVTPAAVEDGFVLNYVCLHALRQPLVLLQARRLMLDCVSVCTYVGFARGILPSPMTRLIQLKTSSGGLMSTARD